MRGAAGPPKPSSEARAGGPPPPLPRAGVGENQSWLTVPLSVW